MSASAHEKSPAGAALGYLLASVFCVFFCAVYEHFGHGVTSPYMRYMFLFPLCLGALPFGALAARRPAACPGSGHRALHACATATLTLGACIRGVMDIFGTSSPYIPVYFLIGGTGLAVSAVLYVLRKQ